MRVIVTAAPLSAPAGVQNEKGLFLTEDEVAILKDILNSAPLDEDSLIDQELALISAIMSVIV